ncbi:MAG: alpha/beta fold hydrolase [Burkholderiaceae bacterium]
MKPKTLTPRPVQIQTADEFTLTGLRYEAQAPSKAYVVVAGATGVPQSFYRHFASFAAGRGYTTLTLDYRGIGLSKPKDLKGFQMSYLDWAHQDLSAAVASVPEDGMPLFMVGHSFGGHAFGLLPNHQRVSRFYTFATGAGWSGWMPRTERLRVLIMWHLLGPLLVKWDGYLSWSKLGMGEDLPLGVYRDWKKWCAYPHYFFDDDAVAFVRDRFASVKTPIVAANALDDRWATPASRNAFMQGYSASDWIGVDLEPRAIGQRSIGHMGYFRPSAALLWESVLQWFEQPEIGSPASV